MEHLSMLAFENMSLVFQQKNANMKKCKSVSLVLFQKGQYNNRLEHMFFVSAKQPRKANLPK